MPGLRSRLKFSSAKILPDAKQPKMTAIRPGRTSCASISVRIRAEIGFKGAQLRAAKAARMRGAGRGELNLPHHYHSASTVSVGAGVASKSNNNNNNNNKYGLVDFDVDFFLQDSSYR